MAKDHISIEVDAIDLDQRKSKCKIEEKYRVANFNVEHTKRETSPQSYDKSEAQKAYHRTWQEFIKFRWWRNIILRNFLIGCGYLTLHFLIQTLYQYDLLCPNQLEDEQCRCWAQNWFKRWNVLMKDMAKVITFLVGFYVSTNVRRWWEQIKAIPTPLNVCMQFENYTENITPDQALCLKKKVVQYLHLSWTLVMTQRGSDLYRDYSEGQRYIDKGLITEEEDKYLKLETEECNDSYQTLWFVPLNWAIILLKKASMEKKLKDPKDLIKDIMKFHIDLRYILEHKSHRMPVIFSAAVWMAVTSWLIVTLVGAQNTDHNNDPCARATSIAELIIFTVPGHELFLVMLILSWLQAADKLLNPFGRDKGYDVNLERWLDSSLWRSSKTRQQQDLAAREGRLLFLDWQ